MTMDYSVGDDISRALLISAKKIKRDSKDVDKLADMVYKGLQKGFKAKDWDYIYKTINAFSDKRFTFYMAAYKYPDNTFYYELYINRTKKFSKRLGERLKILFSGPKRRRKVRDDLWLENEDREQLLTKLEEGLDEGLSERYKRLVSELCHTIFYTYFEFQIEKDKESNKPTLVFTYF